LEAPPAAIALLNIWSWYAGPATPNWLAAPPYASQVPIANWYAPPPLPGPQA
jgi:hypothetical protein